MQLDRERVLAAYDDGAALRRSQHRGSATEQLRCRARTGTPRLSPGTCSPSPATTTGSWMRRRAELGNWTTGDRHGEGFAGLGPTEHLADVVTQLFLCDMARRFGDSRPMA